MRIELFFLLLLIIVANGAPIILRWVANNRIKHPIDFGWHFFDGRPLFGSSKTWPGLAVACVSTALVAELIGLGFLFGLQIAALAMAGDLGSSFIKRRLNRDVSSQALVIDQLPESLLPTLSAHQRLHLDPLDILLVVVAFIVFELFMSRMLYTWGIRKRPY